MSGLKGESITIKGERWIVRADVGEATDGVHFPFEDLGREMVIPDDVSYLPQERWAEGVQSSRIVFDRVTFWIIGEDDMAMILYVDDPHGSSHMLFLDKERER